MKKILLIAVACSAVFASCKKDGGKEEEDPFKLEYSNLSTEQHKQKMEQAGIEFVQKINTLPDEKFVDVLDYFASLELDLETESESVASIFAVGKAAKTKNFNALFNASTSATNDAGKLSDLYKIYTWDRTEQEWVESSSTDKLEFRFPSDASKTSNNATLTFSYVKSNTTATYEGESAELPASMTAVLKVDNKEELKYTSSFEYKNDGTPTKADINLVLGAFTLKTKVDNSSSAMSSEFSLAKGTEVLLSLTTSAAGNMTVDNANSADDLDEFLKSANASFEIMNFKLLGQVDIKGIADAERAADNLSNDLQNVKEAEAWNKHAKFVAVNKTDNTLIAKVEFEPGRDDYESCYWNGQSNHCYSYTDYYLEPKLVFKDGSKTSFEAFFENGFAQLIDDLEEFGEKFE
ncbi:hypothetical protein [Pedobacter sp. SYSU D00535]|uniref:hypothetical protein n=1 Tax=Pedobacter sp. SYSU D00535 TaxID=2810308 RepID=UPI001A9593A1|nr:hypothetical protein [Pedobacter sp. SYSU D00535]